MAVAEVAHGYSGKKVEILLAPFIPEPAAFATHKNHGGPGIGTENMFLTLQLDIIHNERSWK
jgi:hypothetical protein